LLYETSLGYCLFEINGYEEIQQKNEEFQNSVLDFKKVSKLITLKASLQFKTSKQAQDNIIAITKRQLTEDLTEFLKVNLPTKKKSTPKNFSLAVIDPKLGKVITETLNIPIQVGEFINEIVRAIRYHIHKYLKVSDDVVTKSQLGLGHSYSRTKCMFDVNRQDKPVIQSIALIDQLDKNINSFCMRIKEWFGWHFPELSRIVADNNVYVKIVNLIQTRQNFNENKEELLPQLEELTLDPEIAKQIADASTTSMGSDLNEIDLFNVKYFCDKVKNLIKYREEMLNYLKEKMKNVAPNVSALVGEIVAARLISHLVAYPISLNTQLPLFKSLEQKKLCSEL